jgi:methylated-DNA-[protein]-cysteine S-methyltransferase
MTKTDTRTETGRSMLEEALARYAPQVREPRIGHGHGDLRYVLEDTAVGRLLLTARTDGTLVTSMFAPDDEQADAALDRVARRLSPRVVRGGSVLDDIRRQLEQYFRGRRRRFDVRVDLALATPFQREVLVVLAEHVPYGGTASYGRLARDVGRPAAARAVGGALNHNPLCVVLPCHRVVSADGALTGYAGGLDAKRRLLELEAAGSCAPAHR